MTSLHILVVDDDRLSTKTLSALLRKRGHIVFEALTAQEALVVAEAEFLDFVISDIDLPDDKGWVLFERLRRLIPTLQGVAVTGCRSAEDKMRSENAGFAAHLVKPIKIADLEVHMLRLLPPEEHLGAGRSD